MALIGSFPKQPGETLPFDISYAAVIGNRVASSITAVITVPAGMTKVSEEVSGDALQVYVAGGTDGQVYRWRIVATITISGRQTIVEDEVDVLVEEVANVPF